MDRGPRYQDEEYEEDYLPFEGLEKSTALQQCRVFNAVPLKIAECLDAITQNLYLIFTGAAQLTEMEATDVFFLSTKLLQSDDKKLRRLHYVLMKELSSLVEQSFIASNSLMNDIKSNSEATKCNAIRTLFKVMDSSMLNSLDRTIMEALTSNSGKVVSTALITGLHIAQTNPDLTRKWVSQIVEVLRQRGKVQYLAIALLHKLRKNDRLSVIRLMDDAKRNEIRSPFALCLLIKMCTELMKENFRESLDVYKFVASMMQNSNDVVVFEAVKSICSLQNTSASEVAPAVMVCHLYLSSQNPVHRVASIRLLNQVATVHPEAVQPINKEIEALLNDSNRICATLAITTLLKTSTETAIDRLVGQLSTAGYLNELGDEFKMVIVDAMRVLNAKFPSKYPVLLGFLFKALSEEGTSQLKESVIDTMIDISKMNPESNEAVLLHLAEFIDDCEFQQITKRVLMHLGEEVPSTCNPRKFIRYVYNHATLEVAEIRAVAVSTLAKLAARVPSIRRPIVTLLRRTAHDVDDEVRDRAVFYAQLFEYRDEVAIRTLVTDVSAAVAQTRLHSGMSKPAIHRTTVEGIAAAQASRAAGDDRGASAGGSDGAAASGHAADGSYMLSDAVIMGSEHLRKIKQLRQLGEPLVSCEPTLLTDPDSEYVISLIKHIYATHVVFQFKVVNTMGMIDFINASIETETEELEAEPLFAIPIEEVKAGDTKYCYVVLQYEENAFPTGTVECRFHFTMRDEEGSPSGDEEVYPIESFDLNISDFISKMNLGSSYDQQWGELRAEESDGTYSLKSMRNLTMAAHELIDFFGMYVEGGKPEKITKTSHQIRMAGTLANTEKTLVLVNAKVFIASDNSVALQLIIRGGNEDIRDYLSTALLS